MKTFINWLLLAVVVVGIGMPPANARTEAQGTAMARRAAIVDCYRQYSAIGIHSGFRIVDESYSDGKYTVTMDAN